MAKRLRRDLVLIAMTAPGLLLLIAFHPGQRSGSRLGVKYVTDAPIVNVTRARSEAARKLDRMLRRLVPRTLADDAVYLYSETASDRFSGVPTRLSSLPNDIPQGRRPVSDWRLEAGSWGKRYDAQRSAELTEAYHAGGRG